MGKTISVDNKELVNRIKTAQCVTVRMLGDVKQVNQDATLKELLESIDECFDIMEEYVKGLSA